MSAFASSLLPMVPRGLAFRPVQFPTLLPSGFILPLCSLRFGFFPLVHCWCHPWCVLGPLASLPGLFLVKNSFIPLPSGILGSDLASPNFSRAIVFRRCPLSLPPCFQWFPAALHSGSADAFAFFLHFGMLSKKILGQIPRELKHCPSLRGQKLLMLIHAFLISISTNHSLADRMKTPLLRGASESLIDWKRAVIAKRGLKIQKEEISLNPIGAGF